MGTSASTAIGLTQQRRLLIVSGVPLPRDRQTLGTDNPTPDYQALIDAFQADTIDIESRLGSLNPLLSFVGRVLGPRWVVALLAFWHRRKYDAILAAAEDVGLPLAVLLRLTRERVPLIVTCHNVSTRKPTFYFRYLGAGAGVHTFQCMSSGQVAMLKERAAVGEDRIQLIYWHVDRQFFHPMPQVALRNQICSAGMRGRDYATLVAAVRDLDVDVKIAADSNWYQQEVNISSAELPPRVEMRSYKNYKALRELYAESLFVVVPLEEVPYAAGYSVFLEAMAMGKAVITTHTQQGNDIVVDGLNGLLARPGDAVDLRAKIAYLLDHPDEARRMGEQGRKMVEQQLSLDHYVARVKETIDRATMQHS